MILFILRTRKFGGTLQSLLSMAENERIETKSASSLSAWIHFFGWSHALDIFGDTLTNPCYFRKPSLFYFSEKGWIGEASRCGGTMWHQ